MKIELTKTCLTCGDEFERKKRFSLKWWVTAKYCCRECFFKAQIGSARAMMIGTVPPNKGIKMSNEQRLKLSVAHMGKTPWNKGSGKPKTRSARDTKEYRNFRVSILIKASYMCSECGVVNGRLEIDHLKPVKFFPDLVLDENNVRVLCRECHKKTLTYGKKVFNYGYLS